MKYLKGYRKDNLLDKLQFFRKNSSDLNLIGFILENLLKNESITAVFITCKEEKIEAITRMCSIKKRVLKKLQEDMCARVSFLKSKLL